MSERTTQSAGTWRIDGKVLDAFIAPVAASYRAPNERPGALERFFYEMALRLQHFDEETLRTAAARIIDTRTDPFMPTIAECRKACEAIIRAKERARAAREYDEQLELVRQQPLSWGRKR